MKFKGFWTAYKELCKESCRFFKDYWILTFIWSIITAIFGGITILMGLALWAKIEDKKIKQEDDEVEEFLK